MTATPDGSDSNGARHLREVRDLLMQWRDEHPDTVRFRFLADSSFVVELDEEAPDLGQRRPTSLIRRRLAW